MATLENLYGIDISYYARVNFTSLETIVDALGGVDVNSEVEFEKNGYSFHKGINHMDGAQHLRSQERDIVLQREITSAVRIRKRY